ncbi:M23 family metallopeptidase [Gymnodinialimonas sp.]
MRTLFLLLLTPTAATAQEAPFLAFPVDCALGETCMIQQLVDHDPGPGAQDFLCGPMSYDGHQGTDIRVPDMEALARGVPILAAAPGRVLGTRNSVPDTGIGGFPEGQDCGNGVLIEHENGWQTQYCHLAQGSVSVAQGEDVTTGQPIGTMGFSGNTEFPHLHMTVRQDGAVVDPFAPAGAETCGPVETTLWTDDIPVPPGGILSTGFAPAIPTYEAIQAGTADAETLSATGEAIVLWGFFHGGRAGDVVSATITDPEGAVYHTQEITLERTQAQLFRATGRRIRNALPAGDYRGRIALTRDGVLLDEETTVISVR